MQLECSVSMAIDFINNLGLKIHQNSPAEQKYFLYQNKKIQFFGVIINLFQVNDDPLQMMNENCFVYEYHLGMFSFIIWRGSSLT